MGMFSDDFSYETKLGELSVVFKQTEEGYRLFIEGQDMRRNYINQMRQKSLRKQFKIREIRRKELKLRKKLSETQRLKFQVQNFGVVEPKYQNKEQGNQMFNTNPNKFLSLQRQSSNETNSSPITKPKFFKEDNIDIKNEYFPIPKVSNFNIRNSQLGRRASGSGQKLTQNADQFFDNYFKEMNQTRANQGVQDLDKTLINLDETFVNDKQIQNPFD